MSEIGWVGRTFRVVLDDVVIAAVRTKSVGMATEPIDVTEGEKDGWRHVLDIGDGHSVDLNVEGVTTSANFQILMTEWYGNEFSDVEIWHSDGSVQRAVDGAFLRSLEHSGESRGHIAFTASMSFSGLVYIVPPIHLSSRPYPLELEDALAGSVGDIQEAPSYSYEEALAGSAMIMEGGELLPVLVEYDEYPPDALAGSAMLIAGEMTGITFIDYEMLAEALAGASTVTGGDMESVLIEYNEYPTEALAGSATITGGALT